MLNWKSPQIIEQLKLCGISGGMWIDAGCGIGTFTFPLSTLVSKVIAIDINPTDIKYLKSKISSDQNIEPILLDFSKDQPLYHKLVDGILFAFSLHYQSNPTQALKNAFNQIKSNGKIVVIEYSRKEIVSWVPFPQPKSRIISILKKIGFENITTVLELKPSRRTSSWNNASYILLAEKVKVKQNLLN